MDHKIEKLDECIFDYLTFNKDVIKSVYTIYNDITQDTGHRCTELRNPDMRDIYRKKFMATCYQMSDKYENIHKLFKNNRLFLVYSNLTAGEVVKKYGGEILDINSSLLEEEFKKIDRSSLVDYLIDNDNELNKLVPDTYFTEDNDTMLHIIARHNKWNEFKKLVKNYYPDLETRNRYNLTPIDVALECGNAKILYEMVKYKYEDQISKLNNEDRQVRMLNTELSNKKKLLENRVKELENRLGNKTLTDNFFRLYFSISVIVIGFIIYSFSG